MKKIFVAAFLFLVVFFSGCVQKPVVNGNATTNVTPKKTFSIFGEKITYVSEDIVRAKLNQSGEVKLFLGLYPDAELTLRKSESPAAWVASYIFSNKNLTLNLNHSTGEIVSTTIPVEYLRSGKYCSVSEDCINLGSIYSALCINKIYTTKEGTVCDASQVGCSGTIQCCTCVQNTCVKREVSSTSQCQAANGTGTFSTTPSSSSLVKQSTIACSSISELTAGQKVSAGSKTLKFLGAYDQYGSFLAKFIVSSDAETDTKYVKVGATEYLAGVTISLADIVVPVGSGNAMVKLSVSGMGDMCTISS